MSEASYKLKLNRANEHLENLDIAISDWLNTGHKPVWRVESDPAGPGQFVVKASADEIPAEPFSLLIGDVVQNLRSSLDHLVYALAEVFAGPLSQSQARSTQFPIFSDEKAFRERGLSQIKLLNPEARAVIERYQPYHSGQDPDSHFLWVLNELAVIDKHRLVHMVTTSWDHIQFVTSYGRLDREKFEPVFGPVKRDTVIARGVAKGDPNVEVHTKPSFQIGFYEGPWSTMSRGCVDLLRIIEQGVKEVITSCEP